MTLTDYGPVVLQSTTGSCEVCAGNGVVLQRAQPSTVWSETPCPHCRPAPYMPPMPILLVGAR